MATKVKSAKSKAASKDALKSEVEEKVAVKQLLKDERTHKIMGSIFLLLAFLFFIAFTSYLFTWDEDQDKFGYGMLLANDIKVQNLLGTFGAFISEIFIRHGFGIAAYLLCTFFFVVGVNKFFGKKVFSIYRNIKYLLVGLPLVSVTASVIMNGHRFPFGGFAGDSSREWLYRTIGQVGTLSILAVAMLAYVIWRFNPVFALPTRNRTAADESIDEDQDSDDAAVPVVVSNTETGSLAADSKGNLMKGNSGMLPIPDQLNPDLNHDFQVVEKDLAPASLKIQKETTPKAPDLNTELPLNEPLDPKPAKKAADFLPLELEIKSVPEKEAEEEIKPAFTKHQTIDTPYDPILDLRDYKYPDLELLEAHGSERIVQDPNELETNKNQIISTLKNYDISIQKISATVGPTVTLYEIIPAAGVRIS
ncbi:MAG TPA: DNA translocase FtsK 4TM domain-containing protein, partial [Chryseolinea sp.]|nr:DNA translocase FtsK 4TM domain-containing protein [Chryseolinea sp.]